MGLEPTTFCLASRRSTTELRPLIACSGIEKLTKIYTSVNLRGVNSGKDLLDLDNISFFHRFPAA